VRTILHAKWPYRDHVGIYVTEVAIGGCSSGGAHELSGPVVEPYGEVRCLNCGLVLDDVSMNPSHILRVSHPMVWSGFLLRWMEMSDPINDWTLGLKCGYSRHAVLIKPSRTGSCWRTLGPPRYEWQQTSGTLETLLQSWQEGFIRREESMGSMKFLDAIFPPIDLQPDGSLPEDCGENRDLPHDYDPHWRRCARCWAAIRGSSTHQSDQ
jgi:hypothetical protein